MDNSTFVYVTFIRTTPERLWSALTQPDFIKKYWFAMTIECDWKVGSPWRLMFPDGRVELQVRGASWALDMLRRKLL